MILNTFFPHTEHTAPPRSAHVQLGDVPRTLDPAEAEEEFRQHDSVMTYARSSFCTNISQLNWYATHGCCKRSVLFWVSFQFLLPVKGRAYYSDHHWARPRPAGLGVKNNTCRTQEHGLLNAYGSAAAAACPFLSGGAAALLSFPSLSISIFYRTTTIFNLLLPFQRDLAAIRRSPRPESPLNRFISQLLKSRPGSSQPSSPEENPPPKHTTSEPEEHPLPNMLPQRSGSVVFMKLSISEEFGLALIFLNLLFFKCASHGFDKFGEIMLCVRMHGSIGLRTTHPFTNSISIILNKMLYKRKLFDNPAQVGKAAKQLVASVSRLLCRCLDPPTTSPVEPQGCKIIVGPIAWAPSMLDCHVGGEGIITSELSRGTNNGLAHELANDAKAHGDLVVAYGVPDQLHDQLWKENNAALTSA
ncbi:hypothetical protein VPH35_038693 [Triticum aestivum]